MIDISNRFTFQDEVKGIGINNYARIGVIQFTDTADVTIPLGSISDRAEFTAAVKSEIHSDQTGNTNIAS